MDLLIARNPDPDSKLPYLVRLPLPVPIVLRTAGTWPRAKALFCYQVPVEDWPAEPEIVEQVAVRSCVRRGAAIDLVLDRGRENRSQIVFTKARGRDAVFWQSAKTRKQARPNVRTPTARAGGLAELEIVVDSRERYAWKFAAQQASTVSRALPSGDYGITVDGRMIAAVERKSLTDLVSSLVDGRLRFALGELATLPRSAVVVEDRYSQIFVHEHVRPAVIADGLAELQVRWPAVPIVFCETRKLAEEWTYRYLAAAYHWAVTESEVIARMPGAVSEVGEAGAAPEPSTAEVRSWARQAGVLVPDRGRLRPEVWTAFREAHAGPEPTALPGSATVPGS